MSQSSDNPIRQARRRCWAQKVLPPDRLSEHEARQKGAELDELTRIWLAGIEDSDQGTRDFFNGTFGPWASELLGLRRN